jgi:hypothetical protein
MEPGWILTKNSIIKKVVALFAGLSDDYRAVLEGGGLHPAAPALPFGSPKISKGENYQGLPYVMLDYPRLFGREDVLAIRTFFWWGHAFSVTLHLKGTYRERYGPLIQRDRAALAAAGFHVSISADEWRHEFVPELYRPILNAEDLSGQSPFLKLSAACGLDRWEEAHEVLLGLFRVLADVLAIARQR